jgi:RIO-like serine/threonine protein kinase
MILLRENKLKKREVWKLDSCIQKKWYARDIEWIENHVNILNVLIPDYVISYGKKDNCVYINFKILQGIPVNELPFSEGLMFKVYEFCLENIRNTSPYVHGDWALSNMLLDNNKITLCDWDNVGIYPKNKVIAKLNSDLSSAFGSFFKNIEIDI